MKYCRDEDGQVYVDYEPEKVSTRWAVKLVIEIIALILGGTAIIICLFRLAKG